MSSIYRVWLFLPLLIGSLWAQNWGSGKVAGWWNQAQELARQQRYEQAISAYKRVLDYCVDQNLPAGEVTALEAIAAAYKAHGKPVHASRYCYRALNTGIPGEQTFYLLARISLEDDHDEEQAREYCRQGLQRFPNSTDISHYLRVIDQKINSQYQVANQELHGLSRSTPATVQPAGSSGSDADAFARQVVDELNAARTHPREFARHLTRLAGYYSDDLLEMPGSVPVRTVEGVSAVQEAIRFLQNVKPLPPLTFSPGMSQAARDHVLDQGRSGQTGHVGSDGSKPYQRIERYGQWQGLSGENIAYGDDDPRMYVMQLIIDDGVPSRGHRENIFNPEFHVAGAAAGPHPIYRGMCVITLAAGFVENSNLNQ